MSYQFRSLDSQALSPLQAQLDAHPSAHLSASLAEQLSDKARGHGEQAALLWQADHLVAAMGWVTLGIAQDGCAYGSPLLALDQPAAEQAILQLMSIVRKAGAQRLRISAKGWEQPKLAALAKLGFTLSFQFHPWVLDSLPAPAPASLPTGLYDCQLDKVAWPQLYACYAECFAQVPNAPLPSLTEMQAEWSAGDWQAGSIIVDDEGKYQAFCLIEHGCVDAVGIRPAWRGRHLAEFMYQRALTSLASRQLGPLHALVASSNQPSMRLHQRLGARLAEAPWAVFERML